MIDDYRDDQDALQPELDREDGRILELDPDAAPAAVGVYDRPEQRAGRGLNLAAIAGILILLVVAYFVLTALF